MNFSILMRIIFPCIQTCYASVPKLLFVRMYFCPHTFVCSYVFLSPHFCLFLCASVPTHLSVYMCFCFHLQGIKQISKRRKNQKKIKFSVLDYTWCQQCQPAKSLGTLILYDLNQCNNLYSPFFLRSFSFLTCLVSSRRTR